MPVENRINLTVPERFQDSPLPFGEIVSQFFRRQTAYGDRDYILSLRKKVFEGDHWEGEPDKESEFQLVFNYSRNVVLRFNAILARAPRPRVPTPGDPTTEHGQAANRREKFLMVLWDDLMMAWRDVEMNMSKYSYGVLQILWSPEEGQPGTVTTPGVMGEGDITQRVYKENPFKFRSIPPDKVYPVYRTYDHANDFMEFFRFDPGRLVADLEEKYDVKLQGTGLDMTPEGSVGTAPTCDLIEYWTRDSYALIAMTIEMVDTRQGAALRRASREGDFELQYNYTILEAGDNPYGIIPFIVIQNIRTDPNVDPLYRGSLADLDDIASLNKHYNEILSEESEEIITNIHRPLVYEAGEMMEHYQDPNAVEFQPGAVFPIGHGENINPMDWRTAPEIVPNHASTVMSSIRDLTFMGDAGFGQIAAGMTGVGFHVALTPLQQIIELKLPQRINALKLACKLMFKMFEEKAKDSALIGYLADKFGRFDTVTIRPQDIGRNYHVEIVYGNLLPRDDQAHEQNEVYKYKTGTQSLFETLDNIGVHDPQKEVDRIKRELEDPVLNPQHAMLVAQARAVVSEAQGRSGAGGGIDPGQSNGAGGAGGAGSPGGPQITGGIPGTAQPGTRPVNPLASGGLPGQPTVAGSGGAPPPTPNSAAFGRGAQAGGFGPGQIAPFIGRGGPGSSAGLSLEGPPPRR